MFIIVNIHTGLRMAEVTMEEAPAYFKANKLTIVGALSGGVLLVE